jgi:hypothetical protein
VDERGQINHELTHQKDEKSMNFAMSPTFPQSTFLEFGRLAGTFFPPVLSDENFNDPCQKLSHFQRAWLAVRYRHRACSDQNEAFKNLFSKTMANDLWREWLEGEEHNYELEQSVYNFFMNALSVFESLGFCLYFLGAMIAPKNFPNVINAKLISLKATHTAFFAAFPHASMTAHLMALSKDPDFVRIDAIRNILAHRLSGRRNVRSYGAIHPDGTYTETREELWNIPGLNEKLIFNEELLQRHFDDLNRLLTTLISASLEFVKSEMSAVGE